MGIIIILLYLCSFLVIWQFVGYPLLMALVASKSKPNDKNYSFQPFVSIVVPTYNEEKAVDKRITNLFDLNYPKDKYEIVVVDSGSVDGTGRIVENRAKQSTIPKLTLVKEADRRGKASAINLGKKYAQGSIILVTDANSIFDLDVLREMMPLFDNPMVGAVGGQYVVLNPSNPLTQSTQFYWDIEYIMRKGEAVLDSACLFHGEINAWKRDLAQADTSMLSEDLDMALQIRKKGYKIEYEPNAIVFEPAPMTVKDQTRQRKRTCIGTIQAIFKHWKFLLLPRNLYSLLIFPSHKSLTIISPFILLAILALYIVEWDMPLIATHLFITLLVFSLLFVLLLRLRSTLKIKIENPDASIISIPKIVFYVLFNEYLILLAWMDFIFKRYSVLWQKVESTRS